jgi:hypothetical protein
VSIGAPSTEEKQRQYGESYLAAPWIVCHQRDEDNHPDEQAVENSGDARPV